MNLASRVLLSPLFWLSHTLNTSHVKQTVNQQTRESLYDVIDRALQAHSPGTSFHTSKIFEQYAIEDVKYLPDVGDHWNEDSFTSYLLDKLGGSHLGTSTASISLLREAAPILWRMLCFFAWYPFGDDNIRDGKSHDIANNDFVDLRALKRAARILTDTRSAEALATDGDGCLIHEDYSYELIALRRIFRSLSPRLPYDGHTAGEISQLAAKSRSSRIPDWDGLAGGTRLRDVMDALHIAAYSSPCHPPAQEWLEKKALALPNGVGNEASLPASTPAFLPVKDLKILLKLMLHTRLRSGTLIELLDPAAGSTDSVDIFAADILDSYVNAIGNGLTSGNMSGEVEIVNEQMWESSRALTKNLVLSLTWLWQGIFHAPSMAQDEPEVPAPKSMHSPFPSSLVSWLAMCSPPFPSIDGPLAKALAAKLPGHVPRLLYDGLLRDRMLELQQASLVYEAGLNELSSENLIEHLCGADHHRLVLIRGRTEDQHEGKDKGSGSSSGIIGLYLSSPLWVDLSTGSRQHYTVENETCLFQITPELRVMRLDPVRKVPTMACLVRRTLDMTGTRDGDGQKQHTTYSQDAMEEGTPAQNVLTPFEQTPNAALKDTIDVGATTDSSLAPALNIDFESKTATMECGGSGHPNYPLDDIWHIEAWPKPARWTDAVTVKLRNEQVAQAIAARRRFHSCLLIDSIQVYKVPATISSQQRLDADGADTRSKKFWSESLPSLSQKEFGKRIQGFGPETRD